MITAEISVKRDTRLLYSIILNYGASSDPVYEQRLAVAVQAAMMNALASVCLPELPPLGPVKTNPRKGKP